MVVSIGKIGSMEAYMRAMYTDSAILPASSSMRVSDMTDIAGKRESR